MTSMSDENGEPATDETATAKDCPVVIAVDVQLVEPGEP
jgi:hypothetical protein